MFFYLFFCLFFYSNYVKSENNDSWIQNLQNLTIFVPSTRGRQLQFVSGSNCVKSENNDSTNQNLTIFGSFYESTGSNGVNSENYESTKQNLENLTIFVPFRESPRERQIMKFVSNLRSTKQRQREVKNKKTSYKDKFKEYLKNIINNIDFIQENFTRNQLTNFTKINNNQTELNNNSTKIMCQICFLNGAEYVFKNSIINQNLTNGNYIFMMKVIIHLNRTSKDYVIWKTIDHFKTNYTNYFENLMIFLKELPSDSSATMAAGYLLKNLLNNSQFNLLNIAREMSNLPLFVNKIYFIKKIIIKNENFTITTKYNNNELTVDLDEKINTTWNLMNIRNDIFSLKIKQNLTDKFLFIMENPFADNNETKYKLSLTTKDNVESSEWKILIFEDVIQIFNIFFSKYLCVSKNFFDELTFLDEEEIDLNLRFCSWKII